MLPNPAGEQTYVPLPVVLAISVASAAALRDVVERLTALTIANPKTIVRPKGRCI
ncbi:hypothetical protein [Litoreibacter albidus]|uniref:hypothetical protein n=1 Tax=Litoreibacter albidus TaxID=670155 RepID=UPI00147E0B43|nr:hypothetical protein [Litoreibacter albidus]